MNTTPTQETKPLNPQAIAEARAQWESQPITPEANSIRKLAISDCEIMKDVFQPRDAEDSYGEQAHHQRELAKVIKSHGELEPIEVFWLSGRWVVLDGHQRLKAYLLAGWHPKTKVKVSVFRGTFDEALDRAISANSLLKLNLDKEERFTVAWALLNSSTDKSQRAISRQTNTSPGVVNKMAQTKARMEAEGVNACDYPSWQEAMQWDKEREQIENDEDWIDAAVEKYRKALSQTFGKQPHKRAELFGRAISDYMGRRTINVVMGMVDQMSMEDFELMCTNLGVKPIPEEELDF